MVDQEAFLKNIPAQWERRIGVWLRRTTAFKHDETGREAAATASSPARLTVCIPASFKAALTKHVSPLKKEKPHPRCATAGPGAAIHHHIDT